MLALARIGHRLAALTEEAGLEVPGLEALIKKKRKKLDDFEKNIVQPLIRMHGSFAVCQNSVEIDVGFDDEILGSITEKDILCHEGRSCSIRVQALASGCPILTTLDLRVKLATDPSCPIVAVREIDGEKGFTTGGYCGGEGPASVSGTDELSAGHASAVNGACRARNAHKIR